MHTCLPYKLKAIVKHQTKGQINYLIWPLPLGLSKLNCFKNQFGFTRLRFQYRHFQHRQNHLLILKQDV